MCILQTKTQYKGWGWMELNFEVLEMQKLNKPVERA